MKFIIVKRIIFTKSLVVLVLLLSILLLPSCHRSSLDEQCADMVKREKRRLPRNVAIGVVLDSLKYEMSSRTLVYYYTMSDSVYSDEVIAQGKIQMERDLQMEISNSVAMRRLNEEGVSFKYVYLGDYQQERLTLVFNNKDLH